MSNSTGFEAHYANQVTPLTEAQLRATCPNMFNTTPTDNVSSKYVAIDVWNKVVQPLMKHGWFVRKTSVANSKEGDKATFVVRMANKRLANNERIPEIVIFSSHNKRKALQFRMGIFEFICSNGLVVVTEEIKELKAIKIRHKGEITEKLNLVMQIIERETAKLNKLVTKMKLKVLTVTEQRNLALEALKVREVPMTDAFDEELALKTVLQTAKDTNGIDIPSQDGDTLFNVFQRIQGNIMKGHVLYTRQRKLVDLEKQYDEAEMAGDTKVMNKLSKQIEKKLSETSQTYRTVTKIKNIDRVADFNEKVFELAANLVAAN